MSEPTEPVELTLAEYGALCFLVLSTIADAIKSRSRSTSTSKLIEVAEVSYLRALRSAHRKLCAANDKLMGKSND